MAAGKSKSMGARIVPIKAPSAPPVHPFDQTYGTDTGGLIRGVELASGHASDAHITAYYAIAPSILDGLIDLWLQTPPALDISRYTLLDVGAGKGRAVMVAAQHPFARVAGVELNPGLAAIAQANLQVFLQSPESSVLAPAEIVEGDALEVELPRSPTLVALFHPFEAPLLRRFLKRLEDHFRQGDLPLDLLYINAEHARVIDRNTAFKRMFQGMVPMSADDHRADLAEIAEQEEYGSTGDEICAIYRLVRE